MNVTPQEELVEYHSRKINVKYSRTDMGQSIDIFDDNPLTLIRFYNANPATLILNKPINLNGIAISTGSMDFELTIRVYADSESDPILYHQSYEVLPDDPTVQVEFTRGPDRVRLIEVEILSIRPANPVKIHIRELALY